MCNLFSFLVDKKGKVYALLGNDRIDVLINGDNPDSHSQIAFEHGIKEDFTWKFEIPIRNLSDPFENLSIDEIMGELEYDGGLPETDLPFSLLIMIKEWLKNNKNNIIEAIKITQNRQLITLLNIILNGKGNYLIEFEKQITPEEIEILITKIRGRWRLVQSKNGNKRFVAMEKDTPRPKLTLNIDADKDTLLDYLFVRIYNKKVIINGEEKEERRVVINAPVKILD